MHSHCRFRFALFPLIAALVSPAVATNGYSPTGFGTTNKGLAGAGVALPQDTLAGATNPAGMLLLGDRVDVGVALFAPDRGFYADSTPPGPIPFGSHDSNNDFFLVPSFGWTHQLDEHSSVGVLLGGNGGMNTEYDTAIWSGFGAASAPAGVDLAQLFLGVPYARRINETHSIGVMPIVAAQRFEAKGLEPFRGMSTNPAKVTNNGYDYSFGYGIRVGWMGELSDDFSVGASVQSRLYMQKFDKYAGLFAEQGGFDVPPTAVVGVAYKVQPDVTLVADWQRIFYGEVKSLNNPNGVLPGPGNLLGSDNGLGFGWNDIDIYKIGVQWDYSPQLTLRAGVSHADQLFENGQALFNVLAPATVRTHASLGMTYRVDRDSALTVSYTHAFEEEIQGTSPLVGGQTGHVRMDQHELEVSWAWYLD